MSLAMSLVERSTNLILLEPLDNLKELSLILDTAKPVVSFWGTRKISYCGEEIALEEIARKVVIISSQFRNDFIKSNIEESQREQWSAISLKIKTFYTKTDAEKQAKNYLTQFFVFIREFTFYPYTTRFYCEEMSFEENFRFYSQKGIENLKRDFRNRVFEQSLFNNPVHINVIREKRQLDEAKNFRT